MVAKLEKEIYLTAPDKVGLLEKISGTIAEARVNVRGLTSWCEGNNACFRILTENNAKAVEVLERAGWRTEEKEVVTTLLPDKPGTLHDACLKLVNAGINIKTNYYSANGGVALVVFNTADNKKAATVL